MADTWKYQETENPPEDPRRNERGESAQSPLAFSQGLTSGQGLGKYRILERIRTTHHAIVYKARDTMLDRLVTIKQLNLGMIDNPIACGDFRREAQLLARLPKGSNNVLNIHELIEGEEGMFLVGEYASGDWLETLISKRLVNAPEAVRLLKSACIGLRTLHSRKIVHRDIHPGNLIVTKSGRVRITNLACASHEGDNTLPPTLTVEYAAPELQSGGEYDARVDIYALGFVMYEVCVGRRALRSYLTGISNATDVHKEECEPWHTVFSLRLPDADVLNPAVPPPLSAILRRMTTKDLDHRVATIEEILEDLDRHFSIQPSNGTHALPAPSPVGNLEIRPTLLHALPDASQLAPFQPLGRPASLRWVLNYDQSTTTHRVSTNGPCAEGPTSDRTIPENAGASPDPSPLPRRVMRPSFRRLMPPSWPSPISEAAIPEEISLREAPRRRRRTVAILSLAALMLATAAFLVGTFVWNDIFGDRQVRDLHDLLAAGHSAYETEDYQLAEERFREVLILTLGNVGLQSESVEAHRMLMLVDGQLALLEDDYPKVERILRETEIRGADPVAVDALRSKYRSRKLAYRLAAEGTANLKNKRFLKVELMKDEYEEKARAGGLEPTLLKDNLKRSRRNLKFEQALQRAQEALKQKKFEQASIAWRDAQAIRITPETRQLGQEILDAGRQEDWLIRGDQAMREKDFTGATAAYEEANRINPSDEIEVRMHRAVAADLFKQARQAVSEGDLLLAKRLLNNSMWKFPSREAMAMLGTLAPAFDAARLVKNADRAFEAGDFGEAVRLYELALPNLLAPADEIVQEKLSRAYQATTQPG